MCYKAVTKNTFLAFSKLNAKEQAKIRMHERWWILTYVYTQWIFSTFRFKKMKPRWEINLILLYTDFPWVNCTNIKNDYFSIPGNWFFT